MALNRFHYTQLNSGHQVKVFWFSCKKIPDCIGNHFLDFFSRTFDIDDEMHFTDVEMAEEDMFSVENETDANEDESSSIIETFLQAAYPSDSEWRFICSQINQADPVASKLNNLVFNGIDVCQTCWKCILTQITNITQMLLSFSPL